jgi:hypothetical protein
LITWALSPVAAAARTRAAVNSFFMRTSSGCDFN